MFLSLQNVSSIQAHSLDDVLSGEHRSDNNKARDVSRNPKETLEFFGIKEDMTVVEVWPSAGWYTEILAPYLNDSGQYITASYDLNTDRQPFVRFAPIFLNKLIILISGLSITLKINYILILQSQNTSIIPYSIVA